MSTQPEPSGKLPEGSKRLTLKTLSARIDQLEAAIRLIGEKHNEQNEALINLVRGEIETRFKANEGRLDAHLEVLQTLRQNPNGPKVSTGFRMEQPGDAYGTSSYPP